MGPSKGMFRVGDTVDVGCRMASFHRGASRLQRQELGISLGEVLRLAAVEWHLSHLKDSYVQGFVQCICSFTLGSPLVPFLPQGHYCATSPLPWKCSSRPASQAISPSSMLP